MNGIGFAVTIAHSGQAAHYGRPLYGTSETGRDVRTFECGPPCAWRAEPNETAAAAVRWCTHHNRPGGKTTLLPLRPTRSGADSVSREPVPCGRNYCAFLPVRSIPRACLLLSSNLLNPPPPHQPPEILSLFLSQTLTPKHTPKLWLSLRHCKYVVLCDGCVLFSHKHFSPFTELHACRF